MEGENSVCITLSWEGYFTFFSLPFLQFTSFLSISVTTPYCFLRFLSFHTCPHQVKVYIDDGGEDEEEEQEDVPL